VRERYRPRNASPATANRRVGWNLADADREQQRYPRDLTRVSEVRPRSDRFQGLPRSNSLADTAGVPWTVADLDQNPSRRARARRRSSEDSRLAVTEHDINGVTTLLPRVYTVDDVNTFFNPSSARDITVHLTLDTEEDIESHLERFSRQKRLGQFKDAEQYFSAHLQNHISLPPVFMDYADMLLRQGSYSRLRELLLSPAFTQVSGKIDAIWHPNKIELKSLVNILTRNE
jgi:hypothetical protein